MHKHHKNSLHNEIIVCIFAILLTITACYLSANSQIEVRLVHSIWITNGLVIMSLFFRYFFQLIISRKINSIPYFGILAPILFWLSIIYIPIYITLACTVIGIIGFMVNPSNPKIRIFSIYYLIIPLVYFVIIGSEAWNMHRTPLPGHYLIMQSQTGSDMTFYAAITSMLKTYNICSIAIDGLKALPYHFGIHYFLAALSSLLDCNPIYINQIIAPLVFLPLALFIMLEIFTKFKQLILVNQNIYFHELKIRDHIILAAILTTLTNAPFGLPFVANLSFFTSPFQIDSQILGNLLLGIMIVIISQMNSADNRKTLIDICVLISIQSFLCIIKSSASHLSLLIIIYSFFRYSFHRTTTQNKLWFLAVSFSCVATIYINSLITTTNLNRDGFLTFGFFELWKNFVPMREWQWIYFSNGFYTIASFFIMIFMHRRISTLQCLSNFKNSKFNLLEIIAFLTFTAISLTAIFEGSLSFASTYYIDTAKFLSLILLVAYLSILFSSITLSNFNLSHSLRSNSLFRIISIIGIAYILISGIGISLRGWQRTITKHQDCKIVNSSSQNKILDKIDILKTLLLISKISERKSETCLWIPKNNTFFWNELAQENNNAFLPFWAVALSELALIDGYPLSNNLKSMFGYSSYKKQSGDSKDNPTLEKIKICAKEKGFMKLIVLTDHKNFKSYELPKSFVH